MCAAGLSCFILCTSAGVPAEVAVAQKLLYCFFLLGSAGRPVLGSFSMVCLEVPCLAFVVPEQHSGNTAGKTAVLSSDL